MIAEARRTFDAPDIIIACAVALLVQLGLVVALSLPSPPLVNADISNENAQAIAVAIVPVLKLGSKAPTKVPPQWQRRAQPAARAPGALPSPQAEKAAEAIPKTSVADAAIATATSDASSTAQSSPNATDAGAATTAASSEGSEQGAANGTETDPLKARAADLYRLQLAAWFASRFEIRGKVPFDTLRTLHASAQVMVTSDRKVGSFALVKPSGDATFDSEVRATLARIQSGGAELPPPPPMYPEILGSSLPIGFGCSVKKLCE